jgi:hypothetical protein
MSAAARPLMPWEDDYLLPEGTVTIGIPMRCGCSRQTQVRNVHVAESGILWARSHPVPPPPDLILLSFRCPGRCKQKLKVTARMLYFSV